jgi:hypothetical protein
MYTLELTSSQMLMLKQMIDSDMLMSEQDEPDYKDEEHLTYLLDRCQLYTQVVEELST